MNFEMLMFISDLISKELKEVTEAFNAAEAARQEWIVNHHDFGMWDSCPEYEELSESRNAAERRLTKVLRFAETFAEKEWR